MTINNSVENIFWTADFNEIFIISLIFCNASKFFEL